MTHASGWLQHISDVHGGQRSEALAVARAWVMVKHRGLHNPDRRFSQRPGSNSHRFRHELRQIRRAPPQEQRDRVSFGVSDQPPHNAPGRLANNTSRPISWSSPAVKDSSITSLFRPSSWAMRFAIAAVERLLGEKSSPSQSGCPLRIEVRCCGCREPAT